MGQLMQGTAEAEHVEAKADHRLQPCRPIDGKFFSWCWDVETLLSSCCLDQMFGVQKVRSPRPRSSTHVHVTRVSLGVSRRRSPGTNALCGSWFTGVCCITRELETEERLEYQVCPICGMRVQWLADERVRHHIMWAMLICKWTC